MLIFWCYSPFLQFLLHELFAQVLLIHSYFQNYCYHHLLSLLPISAELRHTPDEIYAIAEVPRTLSGKVLEVPVKRILTGTPPEQAASRDSLANPAALDWFVALAETLEQP